VLKLTGAGSYPVGVRIEQAQPSCRSQRRWGCAGTGSGCGLNAAILCQILALCCLALPLGAAVGINRGRQPTALDHRLRLALATAHLRHRRLRVIAARMDLLNRGDGAAIRQPRLAQDFAAAVGGPKMARVCEFYQNGRLALKIATLLRRCLMTADAGHAREQLAITVLVTFAADLGVETGVAGDAAVRGCLRFVGCNIGVTVFLGDDVVLSGCSIAWLPGLAWCQSGVVMDCSHRVCIASGGHRITWLRP